MNETSVIKVSIAFGVKGRALELALTADEGTTIGELLTSASVRDNLPTSILAEVVGYGVWGKARPLTHSLRDGDRVELYRPLRIDPKAQRRKRAS
ncbi:MAG: RnfH family protein [Burkholderiales bacterium]|nr:RnfH family protein [Rhodocyclaceae bacterium]MCE2722792.1 RnfH family protein [Betaproteobacteria bacterium]MCA3019860.1 RnfH family protein [Rhodocyclaceae bacterium]MCA3023339.1 RnfH family protein [Rhodocyclaceae bacterium]MCA3026547.1 RnfH family protein [Rhodocyclaceae bacterium]